MKPKILALMKQIESGQLKSDKARILKFIIDRKGSNIIHMTSILGMKHQTLTARLSDLEDLGVIYAHSTLNNGTHTNFKYQPDEEMQKTYSKHRRYIKYLAWKKREKQFSEFI